MCYGTLDAWSLQLFGIHTITGISGQELNAGNLSGFRKECLEYPTKEKKLVWVLREFGVEDVSS